MPCPDRPSSTSNQASVEPWQRELIDKTTVVAAQVGEYTGRRKQLHPITVAVPVAGAG